MAETYPEAVSARYPHVIPVAPALWRYVVLLLIGVAIFIAIDRPKPPDAVSASAPAMEFSSARARVHVQNIAVVAHPTGTAENEAAKDYIVKQLLAVGLEPTVQDATAVNETGAAPFTAGTTHNILARRKGSDGGPSAILLVAHYDSVPTGPGASDDGAAVGALLETARALNVRPQLKNDVIFLFTDGEEAGSLGARAFVADHAWAKDVRVVLNFEARGVGGPAMMFETSNGNKRLIDELATAAPYPAASSLLYEIYRLLPNDTDLSVFKAAGMPGLNFAFIKGVTHYHTQLDNLDNIDERSLQHQGSYALNLAQAFGSSDLSQRSERNAVYFDLLGITLVHYSVAWVIPLIVVTALLYAGLLTLGLLRGNLTLTGTALGFLFMLLAMLIVPIIAGIVWTLISAIHSKYRVFVQGDTYDSSVYLCAFVLLTVAITSALFFLFRRRVSVENLFVGGLLWWLLLLLLTGPTLPGISYLLTWPLFFVLIVLGIMMILSPKRDFTATKNLALLSLGAIPGILIVGPAVHTMLIAVPLGAAALVMLLVVLLLGLMLPAFDLIASRRRSLFPAVCLVLTLILIITASFTARFDRNLRMPTSLFYALNADTGKSIWASSDEGRNEWTAQFLKSPTEVGKLAEFFPISNRSYSKSPAPYSEIPAPAVSVLEDHSDGGVRTLRLGLSSARQAPLISVQTDSDTEILEAQVNGKQIGSVDQKTSNSGSKRWGFRYFGLPAGGIEVSLRIVAGAPLKLRVVDQTYNLPQTLLAPLKPRPDYMMPTPFPYSLYSDSTLVSKSFTF